MEKNERIICPDPSELSVIINKVKCSECGSLFGNEPSLRMHVLKTHEHKNLAKNRSTEELRYHCPHSGCIYSLKSQRYFSTMKSLKQHYLKVHAEKKYPCFGCDKSFSTESMRQAHLRVCGMSFACSCLRVFGTYEALLTHGRRKSHAIDEKYRWKTTKNGGKCVGKPAQSMENQPKKPVTILPKKDANSSIPGPMGSKICFDVAVQTDELKRQRRTPSPTKTSRRRESRQTQTGTLTSRRVRKTVETQTQSGKISKSSDTRKSVKKESKSSSTSFVSPSESTNFAGEENLFADASLKLEHDVLHDFWETKNASLGTQTSPDRHFLQVFSGAGSDLVDFYDSKKLENDLPEFHEKPRQESNCYSFDSRDRDGDGGLSRSDPMLTVHFADRFSSIETQTETANGVSSNFFHSEQDGRSFSLNSSNTQTQTSENFDDIEELLQYSNTCTQTCNDILPRDLGLSDIQTQTAWPELEDSTISAETQTQTTAFRNHSGHRDNIAGGILNSCRGWLNKNDLTTSHMETQTDLFSIFDEFP